MKATTVQTTTRIVIIGSVKRFANQMNQVAAMLMQQGHEVWMAGLFVPLVSATEVLKMIDQCDAVVLVNPDGYLGAGAAFELGYSAAREKKIFTLTTPDEEVPITTTRLDQSAVVFFER